MANLNIRNSFKLVTDVSQWGLLTWPAESRRRLIICTVIASAATLACALGSSTYILDHSASVFLNLLLITINMMMMLIAAFLQTVLVGDLFFSGNWRREVFLAETNDDSDSVDVSAVNDHNAEFIIILCLAIVANAVALNFAAGDFFTQYHDEGFFEVQMRAEAPDERIHALDNIADPINNRLWERDGLRQLVVDSFQDPDSDVRQQAIWTAGALDILRSRSELRDIAVDHDDPDTRAEAAFVLGKLGRDSASLDILKDLVASEHPKTVRIGAFRGLAMMEDDRAVQRALEFIDDPDEEVMAHAFWVLARIGSDEARHEVRQVVEDEEDLESTRFCAALDAFKLVSTEDDADWARRQFRRTDRDVECQMMSFEEPNENIHYVIWGESVRVKWLKTVGNTDPFSHHRWIKRLVGDPEEEVHVRDVAAEINRQMGSDPN